MTLLSELSTQDQRAMLADAISDMSKDVNGCRYRFDWQNMSIEALKAEFIYWEGEVTRSIEFDHQQEAAAKAHWEMHISKLIKVGARDRAAAIRWDMEAMGAEDTDYYCYCWGLSYDMAFCIDTYLAAQDERRKLS